MMPRAAETATRGHARSPPTRPFKEIYMANRPQDQQPARRPGNPALAEKDDREANEQSGSTGRKPGTGDEKQDGKNSGQDRYGMTGGADRNAPQPGHDSGSSGTSEYGRSDYGEPGDHEQDSNAGSGRADRDETETTPQRQSQSQFAKRPVAVPAPDKPSKQRR